MVFSLIVASRKLHPYFQAHTIFVMTDQPIRKAISRPNAAGRMVQWAVELSQFDIDYKPQTVIKVRALANFVTEFTMKDQDPKVEYWMVYANGSLVIGVEGVGVILLSPEIGRAHV